MIDSRGAPRALGTVGQRITTVILLKVRFVNSVLMIRAKWLLGGKALRVPCSHKIRNLPKDDTPRARGTVTQVGGTSTKTDMT